MLSVSVGQLNRYVKSLLEGDGKLQDIFICGEISNFVNHRSGHFYFSLKDPTASVKAVMFRSDASSLRFLPENGMAVTARARVSLFERDGAFQVYVSDLQPDGAGALAVAFEQRKTALEAQGLFDVGHKQPLPEMPQRIGVVTSESGAALQDILSVLSRRYPIGTVRLAPALVQGEQAPASLIAALNMLDGVCDVIVIGRGGGSAEDLWCFNDEALAKAVYACKTPVISAVGHETDFTICDFVADLRAPTPSAAAELATPSVTELWESVRAVERHLGSTMRRKVEDYRRALSLLRGRPVLQSPGAGIRLKQEKLDFLHKTLYNRKRIFIQEKRNLLSSKAALLQSLSPLRVLERGYSLALRDGCPVRKAADLTVGDDMMIQFHQGRARVQVDEIWEDSDEKKYNL